MYLPLSFPPDLSGGNPGLSLANLDPRYPAKAGIEDDEGNDYPSKDDERERSNVNREDDKGARITNNQSPKIITK